MNPNLEKIYLVYVNFAGKAHAQKWFGSKVNPNTGKSYPADFFACEPRQLTEQERNLTLKELTDKYPVPEKEKEHAKSYDQS